MDRERAERFLRRLAETELLTGMDDGRVRRVAQTLVFVGALDTAVADRILDEFALALGGHRPGGIASVLSGLMGRDTVSAWMAARRAAAGQPGGGPAITPVPLGRIVQFASAEGQGRIYLLSYARVATGPQFSVFAWTRSASGHWEPGGPRLFDSLTATDDQGRTYHVTIRDHGSPVQGWTLMVRSGPGHDPRWLDLATGGSGQSATRIMLAPAKGETARTGPQVTVSPTGLSPGEHLLDAVAARLLAAVPPRPHDPWLYGPHPRPPDLGSVTNGFGDVIAALAEVGAIPPLSPLPGQLAGLCVRLNVGGHRIAAPAARDLPRRWLNVLIQYREAGEGPVTDGCVAATAALPELDGMRLAILGLHNCAGSTIMHLHGSGPAAERVHLPKDPYTWPAIWIRDRNDRWHATRLSGQSGADDGVALSLEVVPPLSRADPWIEVLVAGRSAQVVARLPLPWD